MYDRLEGRGTFYLCQEEGKRKDIGWREEESCTYVRGKGRGNMYDRLEGRGKL